MSAEKRRVELLLKRFRAMMLLAMKFDAEGKRRVDADIVAVPTLTKKPLVELEGRYAKAYAHYAALVGVVGSPDDLIAVVERAEEQSYELLYAPKYIIDRRWFSQYSNVVPQ